MTVEMYIHPMNNYSFLHIYEKDIVPKLQEIDLFLKTEIENLNICTISKLLYISEEEIVSIMSKECINDINIITFFTIMRNGSSTICSLFRRELQRSTKKEYTCEDISYIYDIDLRKVREALHLSKLQNITSKNIKILFSHIPVSMMH